MKINKEGYPIIIMAGLFCFVIWAMFYRLLVHNENTALMLCGTLLLIVFLLPPDSEILVEIGDSATSTQTPIARLRQKH